MTDPDTELLRTTILETAADSVTLHWPTTVAAVHATDPATDPAWRHHQIEVTATATNAELGALAAAAEEVRGQPIETLLAALTRVRDAAGVDARRVLLSAFDPGSVWLQVIAPDAEMSLRNMSSARIWVHAGTHDAEIDAQIDRLMSEKTAAVRAWAREAVREHRDWLAGQEAVLDPRRVTVVPADPASVVAVIIPAAARMDLRDALQVRIPVNAASTDAEIDSALDRLLSRWNPRPVVDRVRELIVRHRDRLAATEEGQ